MSANILWKFGPQTNVFAQTKDNTTEVKPRGGDIERVRKTSGSMLKKTGKHKSRLCGKHVRNLRGCLYMSLCQYVLLNIGPTQSGIEPSAYFDVAVPWGTLNRLHRKEK